MAICDLRNRNPNVLYELGLRHAYNRPVVLVQDDKTEPINEVEPRTESASALLERLYAKFVKKSS